MQCNWSETHPVAHALVVVAAAMALAGIVETFIEAIAGGVAAMVVYGSVDRAYMGNMGLISTVITMVSHIVVLLLYWFIFRRDLQGFFNARRVCSSRVECAGNRCIQFDFRDTGT